MFYSSRFLEKRPKDVLERSQNDVRLATFSGRLQDVNFQHNCKTHFCGNIFSFSSPNVPLDNKTLVIAYSFSFGETSYERPKNVPKWHLQRDVFGTSSGRQFKYFPKNKFLGKFFYISWCQVHTIHCKAKISLKPKTSYFGLVMVRHVSTKIGS